MSEICEAEEKVYEALDSLGLEYEVHHHEAVFTVDQVVETGNMMPGMNVKNLVIKDKKSGDHYMVIIDDFRRLDFKHFAETVQKNCPKTRGTELTGHDTQVYYALLR